LNNSEAAEGQCTGSSNVRSAEDEKKLAEDVEKARKEVNERLRVKNPEEFRAKFI